MIDLSPQRSEDAVTFATGYLTIFLSHITNIQLMREFLSYLTVGRCDGRSILNYLIQNIASSNVKVRVCMYVQFVPHNGHCAQYLKSMIYTSCNFNNVVSI